MEHLLHFDGLSDRRIAIGLWKGSHAFGDQVMILELRGGGQSVAEKIREGSLRSLFSPLGDIRRN